MFQQNITQGPGTGTFTSHTFEILIMLLGALLIGLWLGWVLWGKYKQAVDKLTLENQSLSVSVDALQKEIATLQARISTSDAEHVAMADQLERLSSSNTQLQARIAQLESDLGQTQARNRTVETELGLSMQPDAPADAKDIPLEIQPTVDEAPEQPEVAPADDVMAHHSHEAELAGMGPVEDEPNAPAFTLLHVAMPETVESTEPTKPIELEPEIKKTLSPAVTGNITPVAEPFIGAAGSQRDDLTVVEGIGPKIQELLFQYGIFTYGQLANTDVSRLKEILATAGPQLAMHDPGTWPSQANLAANDEWDNLKAIQKFLKGGKKPT
jgi:predicted flap endonuclease-1-like 5' DNA nuclease/outer membrane murein-binding lipoprotein Lpp